MAPIKLLLPLQHFEKRRVEFNRAVSYDYLAKQILFEDKQAVTGRINLQDFTSQHKRPNNGQLKPSSADPYPLPF